MIDIKLMTQTSEVNKIGKTKTVVLATTGVLKEQTSLIDPVLTIACTDAQAAVCNYIYVPALLRYYFVRDVVSVRTGLYEFTCHVDVLDTWEIAIKRQAAVVQRQENYWNLYLNDGQFKVYQNPNITLNTFPYGFGDQTPCFALAVAGGQPEESGGGGGGAI